MIENERKYILSCGENEKDVLRDLRKLNPSQYRIEQGYLDKNTRVRKKIVDGQESYLFTYKRRVNGTQIEIETNISQDDFNRLWKLTDTLIFKDRYVIPHGTYDWEIDFFYRKSRGNDSCYLIMAEVELPESEEVPSEVLPFITQYGGILIDKHDYRFDNFTIAQPTTMRRLHSVYKVKKDNG